MPKVHTVKKARRALPSYGIAVGDTYYWWRTRPPGARNGVTRYSKTYPKPSQLAGSPFWQQVYALKEEIEEYTVTPELTTEDLESQREEWAGRIREIGEECSTARDNLPDQLQDAPTGTLLEERNTACEEAADAIEGVDLPDRDDHLEDAEEAPEDEDQGEGQAEDEKAEGEAESQPEEEGEPEKVLNEESWTGALQEAVDEMANAIDAMSCE